MFGYLDPKKITSNRGKILFKKIVASKNKILINCALKLKITTNKSIVLFTNKFSLGFSKSNKKKRVKLYKISLSFRVYSNCMLFLILKILILPFGL